MAKQTKETISSEVIFSNLRRHLIEQRPVTLHNTYQGVPVKTEAEVAMVTEGALGLIVHPYQTVCIKYERRTFIKSKSLPSLIRAYPSSIDYTNKVVLLKKLKVPQVIQIDLYHSWVKPDKAIEAEILTKDGQAFKSQLQGIAVLEDNRVRVVMTLPLDIPIVRGNKLSVGFQLDGETEGIQVKGKVHSLVKVRNQDAKRLEMDGRAGMEDEITILAYIARREDQIMKTLDKTYKKLRMGKIPVRRN